jgi:hypothetical protein
MEVSDDVDTAGGILRSEIEVCHHCADDVERQVRAKRIHFELSA